MKAEIPHPRPPISELRTPSFHVRPTGYGGQDRGRSALRLRSSILYPPSSVFRLPSSIFHLPSSIFRLSSSIFRPPSSVIGGFAAPRYPLSAIRTPQLSPFIPQPFGPRSPSFGLQLSPFIPHPFRLPLASFTGHAEQTRFPQSSTFAGGNRLGTQRTHPRIDIFPSVSTCRNRFGQDR